MQKALLLVAFVASLILAASPVAAQTNSLASLGSTNFTILLTNDVTITQTATNLTSVSPQTLGGLFGGEFSSSYNWAAYSDTNAWTFGLLMSVPGANPAVAFTIEFYESDLSTIVSAYQGGTTLATSNTSFIPLELLSTGSSNFADIKGFQLTWDGGGAGNVIINDVAVAVVPEPITWAMLAFGGVLLGGLALRRRLSAVRR